MNPRPCRRTFHLDRAECRACTGRNTSCPKYEPAPEYQTDTGRNRGTRRPPEAAPGGAAAGCRSVRARRTQTRFA